MDAGDLLHQLERVDQLGVARPFEQGGLEAHATELLDVPRGYLDPDGVGHQTAGPVVTRASRRSAACPQVQVPASGRGAVEQPPGAATSVEARPAGRSRLSASPDMMTR